MFHPIIFWLFLSRKPPRNWQVSSQKTTSDLKGTRQFLTILNFWVFENQVMEGTPSYQRQFILREGHFSERAPHPAV
jgi:hypothetical protein